MNLFKFFGSFLYFQAVTFKQLVKNLFKNRNKTDNNEVSTHECCEKIVKFMKTDFEYVQPAQSLSKENCIFFCNHRTAADFLVDGYLTNGAAYLGLVKAFFFFPGPCLYAYHCQSMILFSSFTLDREKLYKKTLNMLENKSVIIYPEGKRNLGNESLPLKKGFIKFAYENNIPVQIVITKNKENIFNEQRFDANFGVKCLTCISRVLRPENYPTLEQWIKTVEYDWNRQWGIVMENREINPEPTF